MKEVVGEVGSPAARPAVGGGGGSACPKPYPYPRCAPASPRRKASSAMTKPPPPLGSTAARCSRSSETPCFEKRPAARATGFLDLPQSDNPFGRLSPKNHTREGMEWPRQPRMAVARRQLLDQQTMAQARLRQPTAALRTHIPTHRARALFAAALGASDDLHTRPVSMQGLKIEQCRGK